MNILEKNKQTNKEYQKNFINLMKRQQKEREIFSRKLNKELSFQIGACVKEHEGINSIQFVCNIPYGLQTIICFNMYYVTIDRTNRIEEKLISELNIETKLSILDCINKRKFK